ncbi:hypothetical protein A2X44_00095 [candidate division CPR3 bacterium GWF2_35_18]|uniref:Uncharacterized protein n=1 Tax=candidate division CPR3 bacterium GW2011_GWF2_35_18 TaxID=1618350 RepID=A0A0G0ERZ4_UNCC3|nr:MAG: hypothetical protein UR67_C0001G0016 [candidate division CPR3 bacterium GW2011_GWF2_35_18]KKP85630.1 MAG: hypothetical protein UR87_C0042G0004 [candidate division CPR3 bacterium GW2011_GWE2_35_7]OGB63324.1 MAG: hypothetical protein A2X44_00095 [candidate division CPR3 bacterium GWF2_35_18]OGB65607.1 MAG: hypothetical protein A2250_02415 [candidate division CPR3 bacterium RIFOXYA2_FULL_35_13]OGB75570.1 MAG: hypothetical protein A2476_04400 [candidate division CPR3 bacterium RIFOXYC2_FULL
MIDRAVTANPNFRRELGESIKIFNSICQFVDLHTPPELMHHLLANETRSPVCDGLHTFDVEAIFPVEDLVFPGTGYGRTIRKQIASLGYPQEINPEIQGQLETAMQSGDDKLLGDLCIAHPEIFARFLYPQAKSVTLKYIGEKGKSSGSHLAPLKVPENFLN